jgi:hypothetical protein
LVGGGAGAGFRQGQRQRQSREQELEGCEVRREVMERRVPVSDGTCQRQTELLGQLGGAGLVWAGSEASVLGGAALGCWKGDRRNRCRAKGPVGKRAGALCWRY